MSAVLTSQQEVATMPQDVQRLTEERTVDPNIANFRNRVDIRLSSFLAIII